jgi:phosphoribosylformylglycinamidine synthase subunit PurL
VAREVAGVELVVRAAEEGLLRSAHDVSGGGLAAALAESAIAGGRGADVRVDPGRRDDEVMFGEGGGRVLMSVADEPAADRVAAMADGVAVARIGTVGGDDVVIRVGDREVRLPLADARDAHEGGLPGALA